MSDYPNPGTLPLHLHTWTQWGPAADCRLHAGAGNPGAFTWVANLAMYMPVSIPWPYPVRRVFWGNGSTITSSNACFGIYSSGGKQLYSTGSVAMSGTSALQYVTPATDFILDAGHYYFAWACDGTTSRAFGAALSGAGVGALAGLLSQSLASVVLPDPATFATASTSGGLILCGVTRTPSGF